MARTLVRLFDDETQAQKVAQELMNNGVSRDDISLVTNDTGGVQQGGQIAASGQRSVPGVLPGGVQGGVLSALTQAGISRDEAQYYAEGVRRGSTLLTVDAEDSDYSRIDSLFNAHPVVDVNERAGYYRETGFKGYDETAAPYTPQQINEDRQRLRLYEEQLTAHKEKVQAGEVTLHKNVITETKTLDVPVTREEVVIERHAVDRRPATGADFRDETISVPVSEERVTVEKTAIVTGEVSIGKREVTETKHVSDTVRREEVRMDNPSNVDVVNRDTANDEMLDEEDVDTKAGTTGRRAL